MKLKVTFAFSSSFTPTSSDWMFSGKHRPIFIMENNKAIPTEKKYQWELN